MTPIRDLIAAIVARVLDTRRRGEEFNDAELVAEFPVSDPEDADVAREFAEPDNG